MSFERLAVSSKMITAIKSSAFSTKRKLQSNVALRRFQAPTCGASAAAPSGAAATIVRYGRRRAPPSANGGCVAIVPLAAEAADSPIAASRLVDRRTMVDGGEDERLKARGWRSSRLALTRYGCASMTIVSSPSSSPSSSLADEAR